MKSLSLRRWSPGVKLSVITSLSVATLSSKEPARSAPFLDAWAMTFSLGFIIVTRNGLSKPLQQVIVLAQHYSAGNLQATLATRRHDETGQLITAIKGRIAYTVGYPPFESLLCAGYCLYSLCCCLPAAPSSRRCLKYHHRPEQRRRKSRALRA